MLTRGSAWAPGPEDSRIWVSCSLLAFSSSEAGSAESASLLQAPGRGGLQTGGRLPPPAAAVAAAARFCRAGVREAPAAGGAGCDGVASRTLPSGSSAADLPPWRLKAGEKMDACTPGGGGVPSPCRPLEATWPADWPAAAAGRRGGLTSLSLELELRLVRRERVGRGAGAGDDAVAGCSAALRSAWWSAGGTACGCRSWCAVAVAGRAAEAAAVAAAAPRFGRCRRHMCPCKIGVQDVHHIGARVVCQAMTTECVGKTSRFLDQLELHRTLAAGAAGTATPVSGPAASSALLRRLSRCACCTLADAAVAGCPFGPVNDGSRE